MNPQATDEQLLRQFAKGDREALGELAVRYEVALLGFVCGLLGGRRDLAMDVVQETWVRVIRYAGSYNGRSSVKTWLYRIAINRCRSHKAARDQLYGAQIPTDDAVEAQANSSQDNLDERELLQHAMQQLSPAKRAILLLCYHAGMTHEQASSILEIPVGTLKSRLHATLNDLRETLTAETRT